MTRGCNEHNRHAQTCARAFGTGENIKKQKIWPEARQDGCGNEWAEGNDTDAISVQGGPEAKNRFSLICTP